MMLKAIAALTLTAGLAGSAAPAFASRATPGPGNRPARAAQPGPFACVGAAQHKAAQQLRLQALQADRAALAARLGAAQAANNAQAVGRITANIARLDARISQLQANIARFGNRCP